VLELFFISAVDYEGFVGFSLHIILAYAIGVVWLSLHLHMLCTADYFGFGGGGAMRPLE